jgi:hypothetical protein
MFAPQFRRERANIFPAPSWILQERVMKQAALVLIVALAATPAWAGSDSMQAGKDSVDAGARLSAAGVDAASHGNFVGGSVAVPLGLASTASGMPMIAGGTALNAAAEPFHAAFDKNPLPLTRETVTPQPAPVVPHDAQPPKQ